MAIITDCSGCGQGLRVPDSFAGKKIKCPKCRASVRIPTGEEELPEPEPVDDPFAGEDPFGDEDPFYDEPAPSPRRPVRTKMRRERGSSRGRRSVSRGLSRRRSRETARDIRDGEDRDGFSPGIDRALAGTRPWVLFLAILGLIGAGLQAVMFLVVLLGTAAGGGSGGAAGVLVWIVVYGPGAAVNVLLSVFLLSYARSIRDYLAQGSPRALEKALQAQRSYWKLLGIVVLIGLALVLMGVLLVLGGALTLGGGLGVGP